MTGRTRLLPPYRHVGFPVRPGGLSLGSCFRRFLGRRLVMDHVQQSRSRTTSTPNIDETSSSEGRQRIIRHREELTEAVQEHSSMAEQTDSGTVPIRYHLVSPRTIEDHSTGFALVHFPSKKTKGFTLASSPLWRDKFMAQQRSSSKLIKAVVQARSAIQLPRPVQKTESEKPQSSSKDTDPRELFAKDGTYNYEDAVFLRDLCDCSECVDPSTRQRNFSSANIPINISPKLEGRDPDGTWNVSWENDIPGFDSSHVSRYSASRIQALTDPGGYNTYGFHLSDRMEWNKETINEQVCWVDYENFMNDEPALKSVLFSFWKDGLIFVKNVPSDPLSVAKLGERIGPLKSTFYGSTWDVRSVPDAKNVAYTNKHLDFHMDLLYMKDPPFIQLLHCLRNSCSGGESRFVDTLKAVNIMDNLHPKESAALRRSEVKFTYVNDGHSYNCYHKILATQGLRTTERLLYNEKHKTSFAPVTGVFWSPPFQGGLVNFTNDKAKDRNVEFVKAAKVFAGILEREDMVYEIKLEEGTCVIFNNRRIAHARNAFQVENGERWLRGAYVDQEAFTSKANVLGVGRGFE